MNHPARTDREWLELITACRTSGLNDKDWCESNDIPISTFYNAARRLRRKACEIPTPAEHKSVIDLTSSPDVVRVDIVDEGHDLALPAPKRHLDNPYTIEVQLDNATMRLTNDVDPQVAGQLIRMIGGAYAR